MTDHPLIAAARACITMPPEYYDRCGKRWEAATARALAALPSTPVALVEVALIERAAEYVEEDARMVEAGDGECWDADHSRDLAAALRRSLGQGDKS